MVNSVLGHYMRTIVACLALLTAVVSHAETVQSILVCESWPVVREVINNSAERPLLRGVSNRGINNELVQFETIIFVNPDSGSFTVVERWNDELFCVVQSGVNMHTHSK